MPRIARDGEAFLARTSAGDWRNTWHPPGPPPDGAPHGASGFCVTPAGEVVLIAQREDGRWEWPGGRPEAGETWEDTFRREMLEETCSVVGAARLLGYCRGECLSGPEAGLVLVRSIWRGEVELQPWEAKFEVRERRLLPAAALWEPFWMDLGWEPLMYRALVEAGLQPAGA